jgi:hypothetical protein
MVDCRSPVLHTIHDPIANDMTHRDSTPFPVLHVTDAVNRTLWHLRTCHPNPDRLIKISKISKGMPKIRHPRQIEKCSDCLIAKIRKAARGSDPSFVATHLGQALALDVGFMFQRSKNQDHAEILTGINGCNVYCIVYDVKTELLFGITSKGKRLSLPWLHLLLTRIAPPALVSRRIIRMDLGGETGLNQDAQALLDRHGFISQPTGAGSSSQNDVGERPHQTIANAVFTMLINAHLPPKYWEYAFYFFLLIHTILPHGTNTESPYFKANLSHLRIFGCRIYALGTKKRVGKLTMDNIVRCCFLGYGGSMKNFIYENLETQRICRATHATFDEAELNSPLAGLSPNSRALWNSLSRLPGTSIGPTDEILTPPENFCVFTESSPFIITQVIKVPLTCTFDLLGLTLEADHMSRRKIIVNVTEFSSASYVYWEHDLRFRTIVMIDSTPVFLISDVTHAMSTISPDTHVEVSLTVAEYPPDLSTQALPLPQIALDQLRAVHHIIHDWDLADPVLLVTSANASTMAYGTVHTRCTCLKGPHRVSWIDAEFAQMDKHHSYGMYAPPIPRSAVPPSA